MGSKSQEQETLWVLEKVDHPRFPYRLTITRGGEVVLALRTQDRWPGSQGNIFCLPEEGREFPPPTGVLERVPVVSLRRYGKRLSVVLDRPTHRRCDFLFLKKPYKNRPGEYEQVFWQTQQGLRERRPRVRFTVRPPRHMHIVIDTRERYPWRFTGCRVERQRLPVGDYALLVRGEIRAVIERKTFANLVRDLSDLRVLHQRLGELSAYPAPALAVEAHYADFLRSDRVKPLNVRYCVQALAELVVLHPGLAIQFLGNRKLANAWALSYFSAAAGYAQDDSPLRVREALARYGAREAPIGPLLLQVRRVIEEELPPEFAFHQLQAWFPGVDKERLRYTLRKLQARGEIRCQGRGRAARWVKLSQEGSGGRR
ncbi:MAG TPA: hypothetical protein ENI38_03750 [Candidatus Acetothermia bacterium]|nr:hypothetical protein [Candidatus Acetothermia bacterium]